jgi:hypothetical protein
MDGLHGLLSPVEELRRSFTLRIVFILYLDPRALFEVSSVVPVFQFGDDAFEVTLANQLEQTAAFALKVICIANSGIVASAYSYPAQFRLSVNEGI